MSDTPDLSAEDFAPDDASGVSDAELRGLLAEARASGNEPLRRYTTGNRDWDFNTDGMAHYGLMPDFLQDLRNVGLSPSSLTPLFRSAEDYIQMWEKTVRSSGPRK